MSERATRRTAILGGLETTYGTPYSGFTTTDAILCVDKPEITFEQQTVDRNLVLPWMGNSQQLPGRSLARTKFRTELVASGVAGTPPACGKWLQGCGFTETITASTCVKYTLVNENFSSLTQRYNKAGVRYTCQGARGNVAIGLNAYGIPMLDFEYLGYNNQPVAASVPSVDYSAFVDPLVVNTENSGHFYLDPTLNANGSMTGGTQFPLKSLSWDLGNKLVPRAIVDGERVAIADRSVTGKLVIDLDVADEVTWWGEVMAVTPRGLGFVHGASAGKKVSVYAPKAQRVRPQHVDDDGFLLQSYDLRAVPGLTGTPELTIVFW